MKVSLIAAIAPGGVIGHRKDLPWRLSADLRRFKKLTLGHHLLVGRKTWETIGRVLPGRRMIVVSRQKLELPEGAQLAATVETGLELASTAGEDELFVGGGGQIYDQSLPRADRLYLTRVHGDYEGDTYFPELPHEQWKLVASEPHPADSRNEVPLTFEIYDRLLAVS